MKSKQFKNISVRGRVAFAICCFENAIEYFAFDKSDWLILIDKFWTFTNIRFLDDWHEQAAEYIADSILEEVDFKIKAIEHMSKDEYDVLANLYKNSNEVICELSNQIFYVGTVDLYGALVNFSQYTLKELQEVIDIMQLNKIPMPEIKFFEKFKFSDSQGWGDTFTRQDIFNKY